MEVWKEVKLTKLIKKFIEKNDISYEMFIESSFENYNKVVIKDIENKHIYTSNELSKLLKADLIKIILDPNYNIFEDQKYNTDNLNKIE